MKTYRTKFEARDGITRYAEFREPTVIELKEIAANALSFTKMEKLYDNLVISAINEPPASLPLFLRDFKVRTLWMLFHQIRTNEV